MHNLSLLGEEVRHLNHKRNEFYVEMNCLLIKNKRNQQIWRTVSSLPLPEFAFLVRWGSFMQFLNFSSENVNEISAFVEALDNNH